jgi:hypothetical protein
MLICPKGGEDGQYEGCDEGGAGARASGSASAQGAQIVIQPYSSSVAGFQLASSFNDETLVYGKMF